MANIVTNKKSCHASIRIHRFVLANADFLSSFTILKFHIFIYNTCNIRSLIWIIQKLRNMGSYPQYYSFVRESPEVWDWGGGWGLGRPWGSAWVCWWGGNITYLVRNSNGLVWIQIYKNILNSRLAAIGRLIIAPCWYILITWHKRLIRYIDCGCDILYSQILADVIHGE